MLATQVAVALQNASLYKQAQDALEETLILPQFSQALAGTLRVDKILNIFFEACTNEIGFEYVQLTLVDEEQNRLKAVGGVGVSERKLKRTNRSLDSDDILADIVRTGKTEVITGWDKRLDMETFEAEGYADWVRVFAPVTLRQENVGVVEAGFNKNRQAFIQDSQIRLLGAFIDQTALALDNAQRYEASQRIARREQTIRQITEKMRTATSLDELVKTAAEELGERLSAGHAVVELGVE
jgi:transcriptional regulator with GAF, ATPase, and Fis domain